MNLEEAQSRLKKSSINEEQLRQVNSLYILLDLHKDDFCKIVDAVGLDKLIARQKYYERLDRAEREYSKMECYIKAKNRLSDLEYEKRHLEEIVSNYKQIV